MYLNRLMYVPSRAVGSRRAPGCVLSGVPRPSEPARPRRLWARRPSLAASSRTRVVYALLHLMGPVALICSEWRSGTQWTGWD